MLPGFGLTLGYTVFYTCVVVLIPLSALVFKTFSDPFSGRVSLFRVYSGTLKSDTGYWNTTRDHEVGEDGDLTGAPVLIERTVLVPTLTGRIEEIEIAEGRRLGADDVRREWRVVRLREERLDDLSQELRHSLFELLD